MAKVLENVLLIWLEVRCHGATWLALSPQNADGDRDANHSAVFHMSITVLLGLEVFS